MAETDRTHLHRCMRCGLEFHCATPGVCVAQHDVLPRIIVPDRGGVRIFDHCHEYKGYRGTVEWDGDARVFHGRVLMDRDVVTFDTDHEDGLESAFHDSVDDYLASLPAEPSGDDDADYIRAAMATLRLAITQGLPWSDDLEAAHQKAYDALRRLARWDLPASRSGRPAGTEPAETPMWRYRNVPTVTRADYDEAIRQASQLRAELQEEIDRLRTALAASREDADAMRAAVKAVEEVVGCGDHSCLFKKPSGMGTNGGCRCDRKPMVTGRLALLYRAASAFASSDNPAGSDA